MGCGGVVVVRGAEGIGSLVIPPAAVFDLALPAYAPRRGGLCILALRKRADGIPRRSLRVLVKYFLALL